MADSQDVLRSKPGNIVSVDQCKSSVHGHLPSSQGQEAQRHRHVGGTLFCDHASGHVSVRRQASLGATDTINALNSMIREAVECNVKIEHLHTDGGIFMACEFVAALGDGCQFVAKCGVGAKHQSGVAEQAVGTVQAVARAMPLHI